MRSEMLGLRGKKMFRGAVALNQGFVKAVKINRPLDKAAEKGKRPVSVNVDSFSYNLMFAITDLVEKYDGLGEIVHGDRQRLVYWALLSVAHSYGSEIVGRRSSGSEKDKG